MRRVSLLLVLAACGGDPAMMPAGDVATTPLEEARAELPRFLDLHAKVIRRTCSPDPGVCHAQATYPELGTPANLLLALRAPCNVQPPDPRLGWDDCERAADRLVAGDFATDLGWLEPLEGTRWLAALRDAAPMTETREVRFERPDGRVAFDLALTGDREAGTLVVELLEGSLTATVTLERAAFLYSAELEHGLARLRGGDPNKNGTFGSSSGVPASLITPGDRERSYLWRRITGTAPGSRMPLANEPLSPAEYVAIACSIEGAGDAPGADDPIDYDTCLAAQLPIGELIP